MVPSWSRRKADQKKPARQVSDPAADHVPEKLIDRCGLLPQDSSNADLPHPPESPHLTSEIGGKGKLRKAGSVSPTWHSIPLSALGLRRGSRVDTVFTGDGRIAASGVAACWPGTRPAGRCIWPISQRTRASASVLRPCMCASDSTCACHSFSGSGSMCCLPAIVSHFAPDRRARNRISSGTASQCSSPRADVEQPSPRQLRNLSGAPPLRFIARISSTSTRATRLGGTVFSESGGKAHKTVTDHPAASSALTPAPSSFAAPPRRSRQLSANAVHTSLRNYRRRSVGVRIHPVGPRRNRSKSVHPPLRACRVSEGTPRVASRRREILLDGGRDVVGRTLKHDNHVLQLRVGHGPHAVRCSGKSENSPSVSVWKRFGYLSRQAITRTRPEISCAKVRPGCTSAEKSPEIPVTCTAAIRWCRSCACDSFGVRK